MQSRKTKYALTVGLSLAVLSGASLLLRSAWGQASKQPAPQCKITPVQAIKIATAKVPGRALNANFEFGEGRWVYGVMIVSGKTIKEVEIDPMTGKVGDVEAVTPEGEAKEMQQELTAAISGKAATPEKAEKSEKTEKP